MIAGFFPNNNKSLDVETTHADDMPPPLECPMGCDKEKNSKARLVLLLSPQLVWRSCIRCQWTDLTLTWPWGIQKGGRGFQVPDDRKSAYLEAVAQSKEIQ
jgi:hypothetical protein